VKPGAVRGRNVVIFVGTRGVNEVQSLTVDATGGNYTLGFNGYNTANLTPASTAAAVQAALEALPSIGAGNITVTGGPGGAGGGTPYVITFVGALGGTNVSAITSTNRVARGRREPRPSSPPRRAARAATASACPASRPSSWRPRSRARWSAKWATRRSPAAP
jgi:hypothetical protein